MPALTATRVLEVLERGDVELAGRMPWSSNGTFLCRVTLDDDSLAAIYKPHRGERPLWDFPDGLYQREVAAYVVSEALGWGVVPETVVRSGGAPLGVGSLQRFVDANFEEHYFTLLEDPARRPALEVICTLDLVMNNADRKGGHCLVTADGSALYGIDHGVCFHVEPKLRTVMWDFAGEDIPKHLLADIERLPDSLPPGLADLLDADECEALVRRCRRIVTRGVFPEPGYGHPYPWPLV